MSIHRPKLLSSEVGLGLPNTMKSHEWVSEDVLILSEVWADMPEPWRQGNTVIAEPGYKWVSRWEVGKSYVVIKFYARSGELVGTYCDVTRPVRRSYEGLEYVDLYLDVWQAAGERPELLDEDELEEAVAAGYVKRDEARSAYEVAEELIAELRAGWSELNF